MLKGIDPLLHADLLHVLRAMGHGDELAIVDANFPAASMGRRVIRADGVTATRILEAVLSVLPLDDFVDAPCARMEVVGDPSGCPRFAGNFRRSSMASRAARSSWRSSSGLPSTHAPAKPSPWYRPARPACTATCSSRKAWCDPTEPEGRAGPRPRAIPGQRDPGRLTPAAWIPRPQSPGPRAGPDPARGSACRTGPRCRDRSPICARGSSGVAGTSSCCP